MGPLIGGFLSNEENIKVISSHFPLFHKYHYLFPLLITALLFLLAIIFIIFCCKETLPKMNRLASHTADLAKWGSQSNDLNRNLLSKDMKRKVPTSRSVLLEKDSILLVVAYSKIHDEQYAM